MSTIHDIPLDAWSTIMMYIDPQDLVSTYEILYNSDVLNICEKDKLSTFWVLMSLARLNTKIEKFEDLPNGKIYADTFEHLRNMGVSISLAREVVEQAEGNLQSAFQLLGWI